MAEAAISHYETEIYSGITHFLILNKGCNNEENDFGFTINSFNRQPSVSALAAGTDNGTKVQTRDRLFSQTHDQTYDRTQDKTSDQLQDQSCILS